LDGICEDFSFCIQAAKLDGQLEEIDVSCDHFTVYTLDAEPHRARRTHALAPWLQSAIDSQVQHGFNATHDYRSPLGVWVVPV
jgi:hypothetical protein